jgi:hypothetical protein
MSPKTVVVETPLEPLVFATGKAGCCVGADAPAA